ncbi:sigma-70 family RNA polymerase sigma factor [Brumimicrobium aurantiacum]|uniref:Sigma-70 family RNA polymerase sigma factor n=2 Tax=Brumimicrobium aurantiacum TaxID=1737063 RepID=A0A3E1EWN9_9FLAO|nr:sigma-70 family RNA polymerase sigma factor [Brumimicrobium aurantiacum]
MHIDVKLLKACAKNKRKAQEKLYEACFLFLMPICKRYHNNEQDARAAYNVAFLKIIDNLNKLDLEEVPFAAWAKRVMTNSLIDEYRKNKKYREKISKRDQERELEYHSTGVKNEAESNFGESSIMDLLEYLNPSTKRVFILYVIEGYTHKEIGEIMEMSNGTSKWHLSKARKELKVLLEKLEKIKLQNLAI